MSLASSIAALAARIGFEVKTKIDSTHPGLARVWVSFGYVGTQVVIKKAHNVASCASMISAGIPSRSAISVRAIARKPCAVISSLP